MRTFRIFISFLAIIAGQALVSQQVFAQTHYVSDQLLVNLRSGQGSQYRILKILKSGTSMTELEKGETDEWIKVRTQAGDEGWILTQYIQQQPIAAQKLAQAEARIAQLTSGQDTLSSEFDLLKEQNREFSSELQAARIENQRITKELDDLKKISGNAIRLDVSNKKLTEEYELLKTQIDVLEADNERLADNSNQTWFLYGAISVVIGVLLTLLVQVLKARRRYTEWA